MDQQFPVAVGAQPLNPEVKKGRGRPKGSRNKPRPEGEVAQRAEKRQAVESGEMGGVKRGRGRPKGSRNKPRDPSENGTAKAVRGRGGARGRGRGRGTGGVPRQDESTGDESVEEEEEFSSS